VNPLEAPGQGRRRPGLDPAAFLAENESASFFMRIGDLPPAPTARDS